MDTPRPSDRPVTPAAPWVLATPMRVRVWLVAVLTVGVLGSATAYSAYAKRVRTDTEALLQSLARARASALRAHLDERTADAWVFARRDRIRRALVTTSAADAAVALTEWLDAMRDAATAYGYHNAVLFDPTGRAIAQLHDEPNYESLRGALRAVMDSRRALPVLLHQGEGDNVEYGVISPVWTTNDTTRRPDGTLYLVLDVRTRLLPLLRDGVPSPSYETVLLQQGRDSVIALGSSATHVSKPEVRTRAAADRLLGEDHPRDFRDEPVVRGVATVMRSPWIVVAKIDRREAEAPIRLAASVLVGAFLLLAGLATAITRNFVLAQRRRAAAEHAALAERTMRVLQTTTDGYVVLSDDGHVIDANEAAASMTGYSIAELRRMRLSDLKVPNEATGDTAELAMQGIRQASRKRYPSRWRRKDGSLLDLDVSATYTESGGRGTFVSFIRDITDALAARDRLERVNRLYAFLNHAGEALFRARTREEAFATVSRIAVGEGGFPLAWVGLVDHEQRRLVPVHVVGEAHEYVQALHITLDPALPTSRGPSGRAVNEGKPVVVDDFATDPTAELWRELAARYGLRSCAALPVLVDDKPIAAILFYDRAPAAFDSELVTLLEEISRILALVLQNIEAEARRADEQERRRRSEERFRSHFESLPIATYVVHEASGQVRRVNRAFINLFGYEPYDVPTLEASFERFFADPVYRAQTFEVFRRDLAELAPGAAPRRSREYTIRCRDGSERVVQGIVTRAADELIIGWVDLTALRTSQVMLREAQRIARLGSWRYDFRTRQRELTDDTVELFDLDRSAGSTEGMMSAAFTVDVLERLRVEFFRAVEERRPFEMTVPLRTRRGHARHALVRARIEYDDRGTPLLAVGSAQDVTSEVEAAGELTRYREHLEELVTERTEELAAANARLALAVEEADAANRAKSAFLAVMSHEIRTPLNGVLGMAEVLAQSPLPTRDAEAVRIIRASATNLLGIIDDILDFSKIEAGRTELEQLETSLSDILDGVQSALAPMADNRGVDVSIHQAPDVPDRVITDGLRVRQICYNLVGNAIKFSGGRTDVRGKVAVRVEREHGEPLRIRITVRDNGIGMSADTVSHLFTSFTQAELSTTRRFGGTGLGLAICKRLTDLFGGTIAVESTQGVGSSFTVVLPMVPAPPTPTTGDVNVQGVACVILRDADAPHEADDLASHLRHAGATVQIVDRAEVAAEVLRTLPAPAVYIARSGHGVAATMPAGAPDDVRAVHLTDGRRRHARVLAPNLVSLDRHYLRGQNLLRAVAIAAGRASPEILRDEQPVLPLARRETALSVEQAREQGRLILVAEDDEVNQKVILQQLALLGYAAEIARDGAEAVSMWEHNRYALLLTDLHMPQMDGYSLTRRIRDLEIARDSSTRLPIIALTANALRGEETRAREHGMDDFLTKPVLLSVLRRTLERWVPPDTSRAASSGGTVLPIVPAAATGGTADTADGSTPRSEQPTLDIRVLQSLVGSDPDVLDSFLGEYRQTLARLAVEARMAFTRGDLDEVRSIFHRLKSSSRSVGALALGELSVLIEQAARRRDAAAVDRLAPQFEHELVAVQAALSREVS